MESRVARIGALRVAELNFRAAQIAFLDALFRIGYVGLRLFGSRSGRTRRSEKRDCRDDRRSAARAEAEMVK